MRNALDASEKSSEVRTGEAVTGFSQKEIVGIEWSPGAEASCQTQKDWGE